MVDFGSTKNFGPNGVSHIGNTVDFNGSFGSVMVDLGQYLKIPDQINSVYLEKDF